MQFLTDRKHRRSLEALGHGCYGSITKRSLQKQCKIIQKFTIRPRGRSRHAPWIRHC